MGIEREASSAKDLRSDNNRKSSMSHSKTGAVPPVHSEEELSELFEQAMQRNMSAKGESSGDGGPSLTPAEQQSFMKAMQQPEFRSLLNDYMQEIADPANRAETEQYLAQLEREQKVPEDKQLIVPVPAFVVKTLWRAADRHTSEMVQSKVFINLCSHGQIQPPSSTQVAPSAAVRGGTSWHLPYSVGPERMEHDHGGAMVPTYDVVFHTRTIQLVNTQLAFRDMVLKTSLEGVERVMRESRRQPQGQISREKHRVLKGVTYKSGQPVRMSLPKKNPVSEEKQQPSKKHEPKAKTEKPTPVSARSAGEPNRLKELQTSPTDEDTMTDRSTKRIQQAPAPSTASSLKKIAFQMIYRGRFEMLDHMQTANPDGSNIVPGERGRPKELAIEMEFPTHSSAKGLDLDVSERVLKLTAAGYEPLEISLPYAVLETKGSAKFDKKARKLVVTLPVQPPPPPAPRSVPILVQEESDTDEELEAPTATADSTKSGDPASPEGFHLQSAEKANNQHPLSVEDDFRMLRETALMVQNDPMYGAREAPVKVAQPPVPTVVKAPASTVTEALQSHEEQCLYDDLPPLESCSEDEEDGANVFETEQQEAGTLHEESTVKAAVIRSIPPYVMKETTACLSFIINVAEIAPSSVQLKTQSPTSFHLRFAATKTQTEYELQLQTLPHAIEVATAEYDVATDNMVVIFKKQRTVAHNTLESEPIAPVIRVQNDLLYELD